MPHAKILSLITSSNSLFPCRKTYLHVLVIRTCTSLGWGSSILPTTQCGYRAQRVPIYRCIGGLPIAKNFTVGDLVDGNTLDDSDILNAMRGKCK